VTTEGAITSTLDDLFSVAGTVRRSFEGRRELTTRPDEVVAAVRARTPVDDREKGCIEEFLAVIDRLGDDPFDEHAHPVHVTASALIVSRRGLVLHRHNGAGHLGRPGRPHRR
jgi:hypothetical protein